MAKMFHLRLFICLKNTHKRKVVCKCISFISKYSLQKCLCTATFVVLKVVWSFADGAATALTEQRCLYHQML